MAPVFDPPTAFALGNANGTSCPTGQITSEECASAAAVSARPYRGSLDSPYMPSGCYWLSIGGSFYYNTNTSGFGANLVAQPVCAGAPALYGILGSMHRCVQRVRVYRAVARSSGCKRGGETCLCRV